MIGHIIFLISFARREILKEDVIKIEAHELYYDVSIYVVKKQWG